MKKIAICAIAFGVIAVAISMVEAYLMNSAGFMDLFMTPVFKGPQNAEWSLMFVLPFFTGAFMAVLYTYARDKVPGKGVKKGLTYGFLMWLLVGLMGMLWTWTSFAVSNILILSWVFTGLFEYLAGGVVLETIFQKL